MTRFDFLPSSSSAFQFQPTLDGQVYTGTVTWNFFGQRYYLNIFDLDQNRIFSLPLIGSPTGDIISAATYDLSINLVTVTTAEPHGNKVGMTMDLTIVGMVPVAYNGRQRCFIINATQFVYPLANPPGMATSFGVVNYDVSLTAGYFDSTLVYREANRQFEVSP